MIKKVLIINRSEIALRIQQACRALGFQVVAVYAPEDMGARFVYAADQAHELSGHGFTAYLNQDEIIAIALKSGADAIHPGYGFLSENAHFARRVIENGLTWIGPSPESMVLMGDKIQARTLAQSVGVPVVPGQFISLKDLDNLAQAQLAATQIGFPVIIKDPLAGGGKAMRRVGSVEELAVAWAAVASEAGRMTGSHELLVEKYLERGRHIEVQVAGDGESILHFYERECSIQRRHQKIIEETPCLFVPQDILDCMYEAALTLARAVKYKSVGTVEFMVVPGAFSPSKEPLGYKFYFLEMNTRLQVEHSVTELTTGVDLVALQFEISQGGKLTDQDKIIRRGHALECRIYAEDPDNNFLPSTGVITHLQLPNSPWMRHDHDLEEFKEITSFFDPMIAKVTTYGQSRELAVGYMRGALREYVIGGITTNISFLQRVLATNMFECGDFDTQSLKNCTELLGQALNHPEHSTLVAAALVKMVEQEEKDGAAKTKTLPLSKPTSAWKWQQWK